MKQIRLEGKTRHGKNKVIQYGELWNILELRSNVSCLNGGTGYFVENIQKTNQRWVYLHNDPDFKIEFLSERNFI